MTVLHFQKAVEHHHKWLEKLIAALSDQGQELHEEEVICDDKCTIGQWIYGDGIAFAHLAEFRVVKQHHKDLHRVAAQAWSEKQNGTLHDPEDFLPKIKELGHDLFMSWNKLNLQIGALD